MKPKLAPARVSFIKFPFPSRFSSRRRHHRQATVCGRINRLCCCRYEKQHCHITNDPARVINCWMLLQFLKQTFPSFFRFRIQQHIAQQATTTNRESKPPRNLRYKFRGKSAHKLSKQAACRRRNRKSKFPTGELTAPLN